MGLTERSFLERMELMGFTPTRTKAGRIRSMTDEELADYLYNHDFCKEPIQSNGQNLCNGDCLKCVSGWLKSQVEPEEVGDDNT